MDRLTKTQQALRGRDLNEMSIAQLSEWIDACEKMERSVKYNKARSAWKQSREQAIAEFARRK